MEEKTPTQKKTRKIKKEKKISYPTYAEIMKRNRNSKEKELKKMYQRIKIANEKKSFLERPILEDILLSNWTADDPFSMKNIAVNLRSSYQFKTHCSVCGRTDFRE